MYQSLIRGKTAGAKEELEERRERSRERRRGSRERMVEVMMEDRERRD